MERRRGILIGCPQYHCLVHGTYECDEEGDYRLSPSGEFVLERAQCGHRDGKCIQTLCALHRLNRGRNGTWFPSGIWASRPRRSPGPPISKPRVGEDGWYA